MILLLLLKYKSYYKENMRVVNDPKENYKKIDLNMQNGLVCFFVIVNVSSSKAIC